METTNKLDDVSQEIKVKADADGITLDKHYFIPWDDLKSEGDILEYVKHLSEKNWVSSRMLGRFVDLACANQRGQQ